MHEDLGKPTPSAVCEFCSGVVRHESWCIFRCEMVAYAHAVCSKTPLDLGDVIYLHGLKVRWEEWSESEIAKKAWRPVV